MSLSPHGLRLSAFIGGEVKKVSKPSQAPKASTGTHYPCLSHLRGAWCRSELVCMSLSLHLLRPVFVLVAAQIKK
jgi:hypothetical protein